MSVEQRCQNCKFFKAEVTTSRTLVSALSKFSRLPVVEGICRAIYVPLTTSQMEFETKKFKTLSVDLCSALGDQNHYLFQEK